MELFFVQKEWWQVQTESGFILIWFRRSMKSEAGQRYTGRICVIGSRLEEDKLEALFGLKK